jgi:predicted outer membrane repeat protein
MCRWTNARSRCAALHSMEEFSGSHSRHRSMIPIRCLRAMLELYWNQAWRGAAIELRDYAYLKSDRVTFDKNEAYYSGGSIYVSTFSWMTLHENRFTNNYAPSNSAIEVILGSKEYNSTLYDCLFQNNKAIRNTISLRESNVVLNRSRLYYNEAKYLTKHLFIGFSNVYIEDTEFRAKSLPNPRK